MKFLPSVTQRNGGIAADWLIIVCSIIAGLIAGIPIEWSGEIISLGDVDEGVVLTPTEIYVHNGLIALCSGLLGRTVSIGIVSLSGAAFGFSLSASLAMRGFWASVAYGLLPVTAVTFYILAIGRTGNTQWVDGVWGQFSLTLLMYVLYLLFLRFHGNMSWVKAGVTTCLLCAVNLLLSFLLGGA